MWQCEFVLTAMLRWTGSHYTSTVLDTPSIQVETPVFVVYNDSNAPEYTENPFDGIGGVRAYVYVRVSGAPKGPPELDVIDISGDISDADDIGGAAAMPVVPCGPRVTLAHIARYKRQNQIVRTLHSANR